MRCPIRQIGYEFCDLSSKEYEQYDFFIDPERVKKEKQIVESVLKVHEKFGKNAVLRGSDYYENATQRERNKLIGGHNGE